MISEVARRYARAILALTKQKGTHARALGELKSIKTIFDADAGIGAYFANPLVAPDQKLQVVKNAFANQGLLEETQNFLVLLAERNRFDQFGAIVDALQTAIDEEQGLTRGIVRAAKPLSKEALEALETKISSSLKKKIVLTFKEDPKLLGGVVAEVGGWTFDDSIETHLRKLNEDLNRSAQ